MNATQEQTSRDKLKTLFPGKQVNRLISFRRKPTAQEVADPWSATKPTCPLGYTDRLVYSFLLFRSKRKGRHVPASISKIAKLSNLHRTTVKKALVELEAYRIVRRTRSGWVLEANQRDSRLLNHEWYGFRAKEPTVGQLAYHYFIQPVKGSGVSIIESLVMVADLLGPRKSSKCLAARFGVHRKTIQRARANAKATVKSQNLFKDIQFKQQPKKPAKRVDFVSSLKDAAEKRVAIEMMQARVPLTQAEVSDFLQDARSRYLDETQRMYFYMKIMGDDHNYDRKKTIAGVLNEHRGSKSWMGLLRYRLGWGPRP